MYKVFVNDTPFFIHNDGKYKAHEISNVNAVAVAETTPERLFEITAAEPGVALGYNAGHRPHEFWTKWRRQFSEIDAAGGLVMRHDGAFLGIFRLGRWDLPKGKADPGESPQQTALREVQEECGIGGLTILQALPDTFHIYPYKTGFALKRTYWFTMNWDGSGTLEPETAEGIESVRWFTADERAEFSARCWASVGDVLAAYFKD